LRHEFRYTLETQKPGVIDPLASFLFVTKSGYCEYFASAMAVMLRMVGVPSRIATGFQGGYYNDVSGLYVIRASDAHAWVEAWIGGMGWVTFDPTPGASARQGGLGERVGMYLDAADSMWRQWVVAYDPGHQALLAGRVVNSLNWLHAPGTGWSAGWPALKEKLAWGAGTVLALALMALLGPKWLRAARAKAELRRIAREGGSSTDAGILYRRMLITLERRGFEKPDWFTPSEFVRELPAREGELVGRFTEVYNEVRFGGNAAGNAELIELLSRVESLA
jgi:hypothetical protein